MIYTVKGDVLKAEQPIICHAVNCQGVMGGGVALAIKNKYPRVFQEYVRRCRAAETARGLLGLVTETVCEDGKLIVNMFTQCGFGRGIMHTDYDALKSCLEKLAKFYPLLDKAMPYGICCGLGGGDWKAVERILEHYDRSTNNNLYLYKLKA